MPALVAGLGDNPLRPSPGIESREGLEPVDPHEAVARFAAPLGVDEMVGKGRRVGLGEAEGSEPIERIAQERTGSALKVCRPAWIASAIRTID